jgi:5'-nucleotidase
VRLLLANDDGFDAPGLQALAASFEAEGHEVWVVAPASEQSARSHALTLQSPLRALPRGERRFAVDGTPADCVYLALHGLLPERPHLVVSGVNRGSNLGNDVHYSGTVAAAREAVLGGVGAVAVSLHLEGGGEPLWDTACHVASHVVRIVASTGLPARTLLNVNVPNVPRPALLGVRVATLGHRTYESRVTRRADPWGRDYFWIGGPHVHFDPLPGSDGPLLEDGFATVTPLHSDPTLHDYLDVLRERIDR